MSSELVRSSGVPEMRTEHDPAWADNSWWVPNMVDVSLLGSGWPIPRIQSDYALIVWTSSSGQPLVNEIEPAFLQYELMRLFTTALEWSQLFGAPIESIAPAGLRDIHRVRARVRHRLRLQPLPASIDEDD